MNSAEIEARKAEIAQRVAAEDVTLDELTALETEARSLNEQLAQMEQAAEKRAAINNMVAKEATLEKSFEGETKMEERTFAVDSVEYRDAYLKQLQGKPLDMEERSALTKAASVIPTETVNKIYGLLENNPLLAEINALHIPGYVSVPKATTVNDASWVAIGTASTDSADVIDSVALTAKKLIKTIEITADIQAMAVGAFQTWLTSKLASKMEKAICAAVLNGTGSTTVPTGVLKGHSAGTAITTLAGLSTLMGTLGGAYHSGAIWVMSAAKFYSVIVPLCSDSNGSLVMNGINQMLLGHKVVLDDNAGSAVIFGNFNEGYVFNYGEGIAIEADQSVAFRSGSTVYRAMALCDGNVVDADAFAIGDL